MTQRPTGLSGKTLVALLLALVAAKLGLDQLVDTDLFWQLRLGLDAIAAGRLPAAVAHSWTARGEPFLAKDWASQLVFAGLWRLGGFPAIALAKGLASAALALLAFSASLRRSRGHLLAAALAASLTLVVGATQLVTRPLLFGSLCLAAEILLLERIREGQTRFALALPPLFCAWVNLYRSWPVGLLLLVAHAAAALVPGSVGRLRAGLAPEAARRPLLLATAGSTAALFLNPLGPRLVWSPFDLLHQGAPLRLVAEWSPLPWTSPGFWALALCGLLFALALARGSSPVPIAELALVALLFGLSLHAAVYCAPFSLVAAPALAGALAGALPRRPLLERRGPNALVAALGVGLLGSLCVARIVRWRAAVAALEPVAAAELLLSSPAAGARGFHHYDWGGYLLFRGLPSYVDGRLEPFRDDGVLARYLSIERRGDVAALEAENVRWVLDRPDWPLARALRGSAGWRLAYRDGRSELWLREP